MVTPPVTCGDSCLCDHHGYHGCRNAETKGSAAVASFTCEEEVTSCYVTVTMGMVHAAALTQDGVLHMFKYPLTNQIIAPISAHSTIQFASGQSQV